MAWLSAPAHGDTIVAEEACGLWIARVEVQKIGGEAIAWRNCEPGDDVFARLVRAARAHCAV